MFRVFLALLLVVSTIASPVEAGRRRGGGTPPPPTVQTMRINYLMGVETLQEFDYYASLYPLQLSPAQIDFASNGSAIVRDLTTATTLPGAWTGNNIHRVVTVDVTSVSPYFSTATYSLSRIQGNQYWGEIRFDGLLYGIFRGSF